MRIGRIVAGLACAVGLLLSGPLAAASFAVAPDQSVGQDVSDFSFRSFEGDYYLDRDASGHSLLTTVETFVAEFPDFDQNRGIIRAIPNDYDGVPLNTEVVSVVDETGTAVFYESVDTGHFTELALGTDEFVQGSQTYQITYTQKNVVRAFEDTASDEFYWDTNGTGFDQQFGQVTARVHVDAALAEYLNGNAACYYGAYGEGNACPITLPAASPEPETSDAATDASPSPSNVPQREASVFKASAGPLQAGENLTVAIGFESGTFVQVPAESMQGPLEVPSVAPWLPFVPIAAIGVGVAGAITQVVRRLTAGRDAKGRGTIIPEYSVPPELSLMVAADLVDRTRTALSAQLVSFAVRGHLRILDDPASASGTKVTLQLVNADGVQPEELKLLAVLFGRELTPGAERKLGKTRTALARSLNRFPANAKKIAFARGWRRNEDNRVGRWIIMFQIAAAVLAAAVMAFYAFTESSPAIHFAVFILVFVTVALGVVFAAVSVATNAKKSPLTDAGAERRDYLRGMRMYLKLAEKERFRMLQSPSGADRVSVTSAVTAGTPQPKPVDTRDTVQMVKLYEKLLPFAVLWGVEKEWTAELGRYYDQGAPAPDWFVSSHGFDSHNFSLAIGAVAASARVATYVPPPPRSSSWSGSSGGSFSGGSMGGGFSGGGGGGGGGGGR